VPGLTLPNEWFPDEVPANVEIGAASYLHSSFAFRHYRSVRECGVRIGAHSSIYEASFFELGPDGELEIGDYTHLWGAIISSNSKVSIGSFVFVSGEAFIADSFAAIPPVDEDYLSRQDKAVDGSSDIVIGDDCWLGVRSTVLGGASLGRGAIVGAGAVVDFEVPPYAIVAGNPARIVGWAKPAPNNRVR
jgi:acetyltransferase-like isoleucine patch superfamily enzyme